MPVDTRSKRASSVQLLSPFILAPVLPDGTISAGDRQHIPWTYSGISASAAAVVRHIWAIAAEIRIWALAAEARAIAVGIEARTVAVEA